MCMCVCVFVFLYICVYKEQEPIHDSSDDLESPLRLGSQPK